MFKKLFPVENDVSVMHLNTITDSHYKTTLYEIVVSIQAFDFSVISVKVKLSFFFFFSLKRSNLQKTF